MELYDKLISGIYEKLPVKADKIQRYGPSLAAEKGDKNAVIFRDETAFELGAERTNSVCSVLFTSREVADEVLLYGKDIAEIASNPPLAHFVVVSLDGQRELKYEELKEIEFSLYRICPRGYGVRISPAGGREVVRVSKQAKADGLSFINVGCSYIEEFRKNPLVKNVRVIFSTRDDTDYAALSLIAKKANAVTKALASGFENLNAGCGGCAMKPVCDEIDGLRELHLGKTKQGENRV